MSWPWPQPSAHVRALMRQGAELVLRAPPEWLDELDRATLAEEPTRSVAEDPVMAAAIRRANRASLIHWAAANVRDPGAPVPPDLGPDALAIARDLVRRGMTELALGGYRRGQNAAWLRWMAIAFQLSSDPAELRELLELSARSIAWFVDGTLNGISGQMAAERDQLTRGTQAERREVVALLLEGAPIPAQSASHRLDYALDQSHRAAIVWSDEGEVDRGALEDTAAALASAVGAKRPLAVVASAATLWLWLPSKAELDTSQLRAALREPRGIRVALGSLGRGVEGFRRSHLDALTAQRMVARIGSGARIVTFDAVRLVSLVTQDAEGAKAFVQHTLGALAASPELRSSLRTFLAEGCNASRAATVLHTHRNTLLRRLVSAEALLPRPLAGARLQVAVALEVLHWQQPT